MTSPASTQDLLTPLLNTLDHQPRIALELRYGTSSYPRTLEEIGEEIGLHRERVRQLLRKTLEQLSNTAGPELLKALEQDAAALREVLVERKGTVQASDIPSRYDLPFTDLALGVCGLTEEDWVGLCVGEGGVPAI